MKHREHRDSTEITEGPVVSQGASGSAEFVRSEQDHRVALRALVFATVALAAFLSCSRPHVVWQQRYDPGREVLGCAVAADSNDIIVGATVRDSANPGQTNWEILRYDAGGRLVWQHAYARDRLDSLAAIAVAHDHDIVAVGQSRQGHPPETGLHRRDSGPGDSVRLLLARFSPAGDVRWEKELSLGLLTSGAALSVDDSGKITVCGTVNTGGPFATSDIMLAWFDPEGNLLDRETLDFGGDETGQDLIRDRAGYATFVVGRRTARPDRIDSFSSPDVVFSAVGPDGDVIWRRWYDSVGADPVARVTWARSREHFVRSVYAPFPSWWAWNQDIYLSVSSRYGDSVRTRLLDWRADGTLWRDTFYKGGLNATCRALAFDRAGGILGVGSAGPAGRLHYLGWRYFRLKFAQFLPAPGYVPGNHDQACDMAVDASGNAIVTGLSDAGILTLKVAFPRYIPPPDLPYRVGHN